MPRLRTILAATAAAAALLVAAPAPAHAATGGWAYSRAVSHTVQDTPYNCLPAAASSMLASAGYTVSQDVLARDFGTQESPGGGTYWSNAVAPIDAILGPNFQTVTQRYVSSGADLLAEVAYEIRTYHAAVMIPAVDGRLPWVRNPADTTGHFVVIYGYNAAAGTLSVWDPETGRGVERATAASLYTALQTLRDPATGAIDAHAVYEIQEQ